MDEIIRELLAGKEIALTDDDIINRKLSFLVDAGVLWKVYKPDYHTVAHYLLNQSARPKLLATLKRFEAWNKSVQR